MECLPYTVDVEKLLQNVIGSEKTTLIAQNLKIYILCRAKVTSVLSILQLVSGAQRVPLRSYGC